MAPGIEVKFRITFTAADEHTDYRCVIVIITEREQFELEVEARGRPARLEFPDTIRFETVAANHVTMQPHLLRNTGRNEVAWDICCPAGSPVAVRPAQGVLVPDQNALVQVEFTSGAWTGDVQSQIELIYDKGRQKKFIQVECSSSSFLIHDVL